MKLKIKKLSNNISDLHINAHNSSKISLKVKGFQLLIKGQTRYK